MAFLCCDTIALLVPFLLLMQHFSTCARKGDGDSIGIPFICFPPTSSSALDDELGRGWLDRWLLLLGKVF